MLFFSLFKSLINEQVIVELKSDLVIQGTIHSVDQFLNIYLTNVKVDEANVQGVPSLTLLDTCFIRGSMVRYVQISPEAVDLKLLRNATRLEAKMVVEETSTDSSAEESAESDLDSPTEPVAA